ncbi:hypothetical protein [Kitasatospora indigofera]|uniref:hypothetical protein n=1 Tax=Kitasatospora indigofera TaxID=67307 RepID=UPI00362EF7E8
MSQPQPPPYPYNPYNQPPMAQQPPGPGVPPPFPGQLPPQPGQPYPPQPYPAQPGPFGQQPARSSGRPAGAFFLALLASVLVSLIYSGVIVATYKDQSQDTVHILYVVHALINGAAVGVLTGLVGHRSGGARAAGTVVAALGAFFGYANAVPLVIADNNGVEVLRMMLEHDPFTPAKAWWGSQTGGEWIALLGLLLAAATAWGLAYAVGRSRR